MSLGPFTTHLIPFTKNGKLQFWNDITKEIIEADFSRPNVGGTSGSSVWRNNQLIELAENEPDWDDRDGCARILMRPQVENLILRSTPSSQPLSGVTNATYAANDWEIGFTGKIILDNTSGGALWYPEEASLLVSGNDYTAGIFFKPLDGNPPLLGNTEQCYLNLGGTGATPASYKVQDLGNGIYFGQGQAENVLGGTNTGVLRWTGSALGQVEVYGLVVFDGLIDLSPTDLIFSNGTAVTRSANSFAFTDLVSKGVLGATEGSIYLDSFAESLARVVAASILTIGNTVGNRIIVSNAGPSVTRPYIIIETPQGNIVRVLPSDLSKSIISFKSGNIIIVINGTKTDDFAYNLNLTANSNLNMQGLSRPIDINELSFSPIALTEAQAIAELNKL
tara:strand:- start:8094 stop:9272 length:1179 start_codon:yes stop_codon:yes gene_type:complete